MFALLIAYGIPVAIGWGLGLLLVWYTTFALWTTCIISCAGGVATLYLWDPYTGSSRNLGVLGICVFLPGVVIAAMWVTILLRRYPLGITLSF